MSINQALGNAFSGLSAASRASEIVSRNIANASTEGYSATVVGRSQQVNGVHGAGVKVDGIERAGNPLITADRRRADAEAGLSGGRADTMRRLSDMIADPNGGDSLSGRFVAFENSLRGLADTPESSAMQASVAAAGRSLASRFNTLTTQTTQFRAEVTADIERQVNTVNKAVKAVGHLNTQIAAAAATGKDTTALEDERDRQIEAINGIIPINARDRKEGGMHLSTRGGATLLDGSARELSAVDLTPADGDNLTFTVEGDRIGLTRDALGPRGSLRGGTLEASVRALKEDIPAFEEQINLLAADLIERFQSLPGFDQVEVDADGTAVLYDEDGNVTTDSSLGETKPLAGIFTVEGGRFEGVPPRDAEGKFDATDENYDTFMALAGKVTFNVALDPREGGDASALQTGVFAGGLTVDADADPAAEPFPMALMTAMRASRVSEIPNVAGSFNAVDAAVGLVAIREVDAANLESEASYTRAAVSGLRDAEHSAKSVDTDAELRDLLLIEQAYQANARVLEAARDMINRILEI